MGESLVMKDKATGTTGYDCDGVDLSKSAEAALADFKNAYTPSAAAVKSAAAGTLVKGQTTVSDTGTLVTIETCFDTIGSGTAAACSATDTKSSMKNTVSVE